MSIEGFQNQIRYVERGLDIVESIIETGGEIDDCISELQDLKGEIKDLIREAEEIIEGINSL